MRFSEISKQNHELIAYLIFGLLTTLINYVVYFFCLLILNFDYLLSNTLAWILAVLFAFITNKLYVFHSLQWDFFIAFRECWQFFSARIFSLLIESALLWFCVEQLELSEKITKVFTNVLVIVLNYLISKTIIFKKG
ncbi:MAG: GtrA family protein [Desulfovibrio sp.]|nr:GtrA family protein [Desulfovibrio sp.]